MAMSDFQRVVVWAGGIFLACAQSASAAEAVKVFNLPVGGKVPSWKICKSIGEPVKATCWVGKPFAFKGGKYGMVELPDADSRPQWAVNVSFKASVGRDGTLEKLDVETFAASDKNEIANSISARWGLPNATSLYKQEGGEASWKNADMSIGLYCLVRLDRCYVSFSSAAYEAERERENVKRRELDARRSATP